SMTITGGSALPKDDIDRMVKDAEAHAEEDRNRREEAETRNQAETLVYQTEKFVKDNEDKLPEDLQGKVKTAIDEANEALKGTDTAKIKDAIEKLNTASQELGTALYANAQAAGTDGASAAGESAGSAGSAKADDVVDAEIVDEDEKK
ncbi:MAG TPA: Hsp70 family protein, partial [Amycolatopsis sp.]|nr:Hsp70 family protein [Amycolatopsis sp.]